MNGRILRHVCAGQQGYRNCRGQRAWGYGLMCMVAKCAICSKQISLHNWEWADGSAKKYADGRLIAHATPIKWVHPKG